MDLGGISVGGVTTIPRMTHVHSGGLLKSGSNLVLCLAVGDTQLYNRVVKWTLTNYFSAIPAPDYSVASNWGKDNNWHGSYDPDTTIASDGDGEEGAQFVGCSQHPTDQGALLVGSDLTSDAVAKLSIDSNGKAKFEHVFGLQSSISLKGVFQPSAFIMKGNNILD